MNFFYYFILIFFIFFLILIYKTNIFKESFDIHKQYFVLLGDSVFKNNNYVQNGQSVENILKEKTNNRTLCFALDNSKIANVYQQMEKIPQHLNTLYTIIFLSIGGNNLLSNLEQNNGSYNDSILLNMFSEYETLVETIKKKFTEANIVLVDIYYPITYEKYHSIIKKWNEMLYHYANKNNFSILKLSNILTKSSDFSFGIEPSSEGSEKIVNTILSSY